MSDVVQVDVLIVGSGPSGTSTALHLLKSNPQWAGRIIIVDKAVHPREKLCGGGVTFLGYNILARLGLPFEPQFFPVREARLIYQDKIYSLYGNPVFRITRREEFDHWLVKKCEQAGVTVRQDERVIDIKPEDDWVTVTTNKATFRARVLVGADGSRSFVRSTLKWDDESRVARLLEVLTPENPRTQPEFRDGVAIFDFTHMTDGLQGYYWDFPSYVKGKAFMNRGLFDSRARPERPKADLKQTLHDSMAERDRSLEDYKLKGHPIRWWDANGRFAIPRVILVGDAAGVDPLFGEGISFALGYGEVAAAAINHAFAQQDFSFADYKQRLQDHSLFRHLSLRTRLARIAYLMKYPWVVRLGWTIARLVVRITPWRSRDYVPDQLPQMRVTDNMAQSA